MGWRRGQVTVFIVSGILIITFLGLVVYMATDKMHPQTNTASIAKPVAEFLNVCANDAAYEAVRIVSRQGGYYIPPKESTLLNGFVVADYYKDAPRVPGIDTVNKELALAALDEFSRCDMKSLKELGYNVSISDTSAIAYASGIGVRFRFSYSARVSGESATASTHETEAFVPAELAKSHDVASKFVMEQAKDTRHVPLSYLSDLCVNNLLTFKIHQESGRIVYSIMNPARKIKGEPYTYAFAIDYGEERAYFGRHEMIETPLLSAPIGKEFYHKLEYTVAFAYTELFNATQGEIRFTPKPSDLGLHEVLVIANTTSGWKTIKMKINVTKEIA